MTEKCVGLLGGSSFVGESLCGLLEEHGWEIFSFARNAATESQFSSADEENKIRIIKNWICLSPIWVLSEYFPLFEKHKAEKLVALSSTSRFTKIHSSSPGEKEVAFKLIEGEKKLLAWAQAKECTAIILQPTLIYGRGKDKNVSEIARFIRRFGFFPLLGEAKGLRQPIHVDDVAVACLSALRNSQTGRSSYVLCGGETLSYRAMVERIFVALGRKPRFFWCPLWLFSLAVRLLNLVPPFRSLTPEMAVRMNMDQNFDHKETKNDLGFNPRDFHPYQSDLVDRPRCPPAGK